MNNHIEVIKAKETGLFKNYIFKAIPLAFDESMSYYETLCALLSYLKDTIIPTVNNNGDAVIELQNLYDELHDYVEHYFDNLDVQEEINNKLDKMAEDGTLADIIWQYWRINGTGITTKHNIYVDGDNKTDYWITYIPRIRPDGGINELKQYLVGQNGQSLEGKVSSPATVCRNHNFAFVCNSGTFITDPGEEQYKTNNKYLIQDGIQIPTNGTRTNLLCIMNDGTLKHYEAQNMTAQELIDTGVKYSLTAFCTVIENGIITTEIQSKEDWSNFYQRQVIAQDNDLNIYILTCDGKSENGGTNSYGMSMEQVAYLLLNEYNVNFAFMLDGGGSTSTVINGTVINQVSDNINRQERYVPFMLYVEDNNPQSMSNYYNMIGQEVDYLKKEIWDSSVCLRLSSNITQSAENQTNNTIMCYKLTGSLYTGNDIPITDYKYAIAQVCARDTGDRTIRIFGNTTTNSNIATRHCINGNWSDWKYINETDITTLSLTSTVGTLSNDTKTYIANRIANVCFILNLNTAVTSNQTILSGLKGSAISRFPVYAWDNNNSTMIPCLINADGNLVSTGNISANASLRFNFSYLAR